MKKDEPKVLLLPPKNKNCDRVMEYLFGRSIDYSLIQECIAEGIIFESADYHNAVFIEKDENGTPKYAACRGMVGNFKCDVSRAATSGILSNFWRESLAFQCIYLKLPLIYCLMLFI